MERKTLAVSGKPMLHIKNVPGDLRLIGWKESQIKAKTNGSTLDLLEENGTVTLSCDNDLIVSVPESADVEIDLISGDGSLRVLQGALHIQKVGGDLALRHVGVVSLGQIGGDLVLRHSSGVLNVDLLAGDASLRDIQGDVALEEIVGDLHIRDLQANFHANVSGDVIANLEPQNGAAYNLQAEGDVLLRLPASVDATLSLSAGGDLDVKLPGVEDSAATVLILGTGDSPMDIAAGGDLLITSHADEWADMADFDIGMPFIGADFPGLSDDFAETISRHAEEAARKAEERARKVEEKFMRKSERYIREAEQQAARAARNAERHIRFGQHPVPPNPPRRPVPPDEPVSDQERMLILKMLEEKKITAAEAEKLLASME
jgi:hypothetical protein